MVEIKRLSLTYVLAHRRKTPALENVNVKFEQGKISVIIGPSGCGKTSLIRIMAGLLKPTEGELSAGGVPVRGVRKNTAVIFQDYGLLPWKTVRANAELPLRIGAPGTKRGHFTPTFSRKGHKGTEKSVPLANSTQNFAPSCLSRVDLLLSQFGLMDFAKSYPHELSGGMKQRLAIVRALVMEPELLLMDEPFSSLDAFTREEAQDFFLSVRKKLPITIIMVSHSIEEAVYLADTVYVMKNRNPGVMEPGVSISREGQSHGEFRENPRFQEYCSSLRKTLKPDSPPAPQGVAV